MARPAGAPNQNPRSRQSKPAIRHTYQFSYVTDSNSNVTQTTITDPRGIVDQKNFQVFIDSGNGQSGTSNANGFLSSDVLAQGKVEQQTLTWQRDSSTNLITSSTDQLGRQTAYIYDSLGNVTSVTRLSSTSNAATTNYTYTTQFSELASVTDPLGHTWSLAYDGHGNLSSVSDPIGHSTSFSHDFLGNLISATDPANDKTSFSYVGGDLASITDPLGNTTSLDTDTFGRLISITDPLGNRTGLGYDSLDHLLSITDANSGVTAFTYDGNGNLLSVSDARNGTTSYAYDKRNRRITRTDPLQASESYQYDGNNNLTQTTDRRGKITVYQYDGLNRPTFAGFGQNGSQYQSTINYTWDGGNRLTQAVDSIAGTVSRSYDGLNDLLSEATSQGTISYTFDSARRRSSMTVAGQTAVSYTWDNANRLSGITQGSTSVAFQYDNANRRIQLTLPNGIVAAYTYDQDSRVTGITWTLGSTQVGNLTYSYDADGRVTSKGGSFDQINLPQAVSGNTFNADSAMTQFGSAALSYDANGNLTSDGTSIYAWDARNHLSAISGGVTASFVYDALGRRMSKTVGAASTQFLYDGLNPVQELYPSGSVIANLLTGLRIDEFFQRTDSNGARSFLTDNLGSTLALSDSTGALPTQYSYEPFGNTTATGTNSNPYQFTGRESDGTGLYFYRARYYSPVNQRFVAEDPIGFAGGGVNFYAYASNNPPNLRDPQGLVWIIVPIAPGDPFSVYYGAHFSDDPDLSGPFPDSIGVYSLPGFSCAFNFCRVSDEEFNQYLDQEADSDESKPTSYDEPILPDFSCF